MHDLFFVDNTRGGSVIRRVYKVSFSFTVSLYIYIIVTEVIRKKRNVSFGGGAAGRKENVQKTKNTTAG